MQHGRGSRCAAKPTAASARPLSFSAPYQPQLHANQTWRKLGLCKLVNDTQMARYKRPDVFGPVNLDLPVGDNKFHGIVSQLFGKTFALFSRKVGEATSRINSTRSCFKMPFDTSAALRRRIHLTTYWSDENLAPVSSLTSSLATLHSTNAT